MRTVFLPRSRQLLFAMHPLSKKLPPGFTLLELLVALFIGGIVTSALLAFVVQLLATNQREAARSDTQRDLQAALDYMSRDVREAIYVYDGNCLSDSGQKGEPCPGLLNNLPPEIAGKTGSRTPVLAFWKAEDLPDPILTNCQNNAADYSKPLTQSLSPAIQGVPCVSRRMYTLVVYTVRWDDPSKIWKGKARISRYKIPQFAYSALQGNAQPTASKGWAYPVGQSTGFDVWPYERQSDSSVKQLLAGYVVPTNADVGPTNDQVLTDFVDVQLSSIEETKSGVNSTTQVVPGTPTCPPDVRLAPQPGNPDTFITVPAYTLTPSNEVAGSTTVPSKNRGFYVCVRGSESYGQRNQEVVIRIQGNAAGRPGLPVDKFNVPIQLEARVMTRGVLNKSI